MLNVHNEIERLYNALLRRGVSEDQASLICDEAAARIDEVVTDVVQSAFQDAVSAGLEYKVAEFLQELGVAETGHGYAITTRSGKTDFSRPPMPMLPHLLKNPKIAKDGSLYKTIPVRGTSEFEAKHTVDVFQFMQDMNAKRRDMREQKMARKGVSTAATSLTSIRGSDYIKDKLDHNTYKPNFRTASSKQDPTTQWVKPEKQADMTPLLNDLNNRIEQDINSAIQDIVRGYEESV